MVTTILEKMLKPATDEMPVEFARKIIGLRAEGEVLSRIEYLRTKADQGSLTSDEQSEYQEVIEAIDIIALLQCKARDVLHSVGE
jgi:regulator of PEP synthase PpsR (kinase-PPPase family)